MLVFKVEEIDVWNCVLTHSKDIDLKLRIDGRLLVGQYLLDANTEISIDTEVSLYLLDADTEVSLYLLGADTEISIDTEVCLYLLNANTEISIDTG